MPTAASASAVPGPGASATSPFGHCAASGAPNSTAFADTKTATSKSASRACTAASGAKSSGGRITIAGKTIGLAPNAASFCANAPACRAGRVTSTPRPASGAPARSDDVVRDAVTLVVYDQTARAVRQQLVGQLGAQRMCRLRVDDLALALTADHALAVARADQTAQPQAPFLPLGMRGERRFAAARERMRESALGHRGELRRPVVERCERCDHVRTIGAAFQRQHALPGRRKNVGGIDELANQIAQAQALRVGKGKHDRVNATVAKVAHGIARFDADVSHVERRKPLAKLELATRAR